MIDCGSIQDYWCFSRRCVQFDKVSNLSLGLLDKEYEVSEDARNTLRQLNRDRIACQIKIGNLNLSSFAQCDICNGKCCDKSSDYYFTPIDFWLTKYSSFDVQSYLDDSKKPLQFYFKNRFKPLWVRVNPLVKIENHVKINVPKKGCSHLGDDGCKLPYFNRPIKCVIYACPRLKQSMSDVTRVAYIKAIKDLYSISVETFNVIKAEAGFPSYYGRMSLILTP